jgi:MFS transporter, putative metabolite transport protein
VSAESRTDAPPANTPHRPRWTVFVAAMGAFLDGYDLVIIAGALLFIRPELGLTPGETGWVGSIVFVGMVVGALAFGRLTDRIGRNTSFAFVLGLFVVGSILSAVAHEAWLLILGRLVVGLGIGADLPVSTTLIAESVRVAGAASPA